MSLHAVACGLQPLPCNPVRLRLHLDALVHGERRSLSKRRQAGTLKLSHAAEPEPEPQRDVPTAAWLEHLLHVSARGELDGAIDLVLDTVDDLLFVRNEARIREILTKVEVERLPAEVLLALLAGTLRARDPLGASRRGFYGRVEAKLRREAPEEVDALLQGLG